jgi:hypothetical protein
MLRRSSELSIFLNPAQRFFGLRRHLLTPVFARAGPNWTLESGPAS